MSVAPTDLRDRTSATDAAVDVGGADVHTRGHTVRIVGTEDGGSVRANLRALGRVGALALGTRAGSGHLGDQASVLQQVARTCLATAFSAWAQRMSLGYIDRFGGDELRAATLPGLAAGTTAGVTAMATAFQAALGLTELPVTARTDGDEVVLDGTIAWASNLFDGAVVVLPAQLADGRRLIVATTTDTAGVSRAAEPPLLALGATASTSLRLEGVRVPASWVVTDRFDDLLGDVRPSFLLLQGAFCLGLADAALDAASGRCTGTAAALADDQARLVAQRDAVADEHHRLLAAADELSRRTAGRADAAGRRRWQADATVHVHASHTWPADVTAEPSDGRGAAMTTRIVQVRLAAAQLAVAAVRHEATVRGGAGYLATSATARRLREAAFLPIQSPTEAQLRWELQRSS